jgi:hypothetical protein
MLQYTPLCSRELLGHGAMAAQQTLDLFILVRVRMPQPKLNIGTNHALLGMAVHEFLYRGDVAWK